MTLKTFRNAKLAIVIILAASIGISTAYHNYLFPVIGLILGSLLMFYLRGKVQGILADERDYLMAGKAATLAIQVYGWIAVLAMFLLLSRRGFNPSYEPIAYTLAYSTCFLMLMYALVFRYYSKFALYSKKTLYILVASIIILVALVAGLRLFSGEDDWICVNGQWVEHGHPSFPAPTVECRK